MIAIHFVSADGREQVVEADEGESVMQAALNNLVGSIVGECGGGLSCATCHVFVDPQWADRLPAPSAEEKDMLEAASETPSGYSRLSCQLVCSSDTHGLVVHLPKTQR
jgi:ferredoxin, 2Fe-2S